MLHISIILYLLSSLPMWVQCTSPALSNCTSGSDGNGIGVANLRLVFRNHSDGHHSAVAALEEVCMHSCTMRSETTTEVLAKRTLTVLQPLGVSWRAGPGSMQSQRCSACVSGMQVRLRCHVRPEGQHRCLPAVRACAHSIHRAQGRQARCLRWQPGQVSQHQPAAPC